MLGTCIEFGLFMAILTCIGVISLFRIRVNVNVIASHWMDVLLCEYLIPDRVFFDPLPL